jgi:hypothetical protein
VCAEKLMCKTCALRSVCACARYVHILSVALHILLRYIIDALVPSSRQN